MRTHEADGWEVDMNWFMRRRSDGTCTAGPAGSVMRWTLGIDPPGTPRHADWPGGHGLHPDDRARLFAVHRFGAGMAYRALGQLGWPEDTVDALDWSDARCPIPVWDPDRPHMWAQAMLALADELDAIGQQR